MLFAMPTFRTDLNFFHRLRQLRAQGRGILVALAKAVLPEAVFSIVARQLYAGRVHWCRVVMNRECDALIDALDTGSRTCLEISGQSSRWANRQWASYAATAYPEYDVCDKPLPGEWDVVIAEQVLEHLADPQKALDNIYAMLRSGGVALITTPFLIKFHAFPKDYSRWTEDGMREELKRSKFSQVTVGSWGNRECLLADMTNDENWTYYRARRHSLRNDPRFPIVVWAFAQK
jgi:SAM-dependent methyltransferase